MTGEVAPGTGAGPGARPELRASHEDRDRAVEILRVAAGDGRLTAAELDERVEAALTARTSGELAALTADLPAAPGQSGSVAAQAKDLVRLDYQGGNATRRGQWVVPARMEIRAVGGTVKLDFTNAVITQPTLQVQAYVRGGALVLVTKPGIEVDTDGITVRGGTVKIRPRDGWKEPVHLTVEVQGENHGGRVTARPPRRTFRQWLLRGPRPQGSRLPGTPLEAGLGQRRGLQEGGSAGEVQRIQWRTGRGIPGGQRGQIPFLLDEPEHGGVVKNRRAYVAGPSVRRHDHGGDAEAVPVIPALACDCMICALVTNPSFLPSPH